MRQSLNLVAGRGFDPNQKNIDGKSAIDLAKDKRTSGGVELKMHLGI